MVRKKWSVADRALIPGGWVLTLDKELGELRDGDVLVDGQRLAAVGRDIPAVDADVIHAQGIIVLPGLIDPHRHAWQSLARGSGVDWTLAACFQAVRGMLGENCRPQDLYTANLLGIVEALDSGITTVLDWSHLINSPEHADAAVAGLKASGPGPWVFQDQLGSLTQGKQADIIVVDTKDTSLFPMSDAVVAFAQPHDVRTVLAGGKVVKRDGQPVDIDWGRLRVESDAARDYLFAPSGVTLGEDWFSTMQAQVS